MNMEYYSEIFSFEKYIANLGGRLLSDFGKVDLNRR